MFRLFMEHGSRVAIQPEGAVSTRSTRGSLEGKATAAGLGAGPLYCLARETLPV